MTSNIKRTFFAFIWHGAFLALTAAMLDLNTVFPSLINALTESKIILATMITILLGTPLIFNVIFSHFLRRAKSKKKFLLIGIYLRGLSFLGMAIFVYFYAKDTPSITILSLFFFLFIYSISAGFAGISYSDLIAKTITDSKIRNKLFTYKQFLSSISGFLGGLIVTYIFTQNMLFPINYTINLIIGFAGLFIASIGFFFMKEPETEAVADSDESLKTFFKKIPKILKNDNEFRRFIIVENLSSFGIMIMPFYIVFAREVLFIQDKYIGIFLLIQISGKIISTILWGLIGKKWDSRTVVTICIVIGGFIPILAILLSIYLPSLFGIVFFLLGFTISGRQIGFSPYLLDIAPKDKRVEYLGIRGSMNIFIVVLPLLGAIIIESFGFIPTFILVSIILLSTAIYHRFFKVKVNIIS